MRASCKHGGIWVVVSGVISAWQHVFRTRTRLKKTGGGIKTRETFSPSPFPTASTIFLVNLCVAQDTPS